MLSILLLAALPIQAETPPPGAYFVKVDLVIVNRVRSHSTTYDAWGRPSTSSSEQWWVSFWDIVWTPALPGQLPIPLGFVDRGWWTYTQCRQIAPCSDGWVVESKDGINVLTPGVWFVDSPYDWEMRNRRIYCPIHKP